jgi:hypothetical protein
MMEEIGPAHFSVLSHEPHDLILGLGTYLKRTVPAEINVQASELFVLSGLHTIPPWRMNCNMK